MSEGGDALKSGCGGGGGGGDGEDKKSAKGFDFVSKISLTDEGMSSKLYMPKHKYFCLLCIYKCEIGNRLCSLFARSKRTCFNFMTGFPRKSVYTCM